MSRKRLASYTYTTDNKLKSFIEAKRAEKTIETGNKVLIRDIEQDLAEYCEVTTDYVLALKRKLSQPSLAVAFKVSQYFGVKIEDIFNLVDKD